MMYSYFIRALQYLSIFLMWCFATGVLGLIAWLITVAIRWQDALNWTLAISLVMTPVYLTVAGTLTYVFIGLQRGAPVNHDAPSGKAQVPVEVDLEVQRTHRQDEELGP